MGKVKELAIQMEEQVLNKKHIKEVKRMLKERNKHWHEHMPDLTDEALADAIRDFDNTPEADDMPLWIQLELDLWEGKHGIGAFTQWDLAGGRERGQKS